MRRAAGLGLPINPAARNRQADPIITGISAIDGLTTVVRGQKLPVFSVGGLPHLELATQIAAQAHVGDGAFQVVFAAHGRDPPDTDACATRSRSDRNAGELVLLINTAADPVIETGADASLALTVAEYLAFEHGPARARRDVLT